MIGATGMALMMFALAGAFTQVHTFTDAAGKAAASAPGSIGLIIIAGVLIHTTFYEFSFGGGAWILISELFPTRIRGRAMSICSFMLWGATYAVTQLFPIMVAKLGSTTTYLIFGIFCIVMGIFAKVAVHETKGKSLEEIQAETAER
jgi:SP family arabinose:H+ symporter-like MFS transporter